MLLVSTVGETTPFDLSQNICDANADLGAVAVIPFYAYNVRTVIFRSEIEFRHVVNNCGTLPLVAFMTSW